MRRSIVRADQASSCYFRSSVDPPHRKALVQITERCNLHCAHCFVSSGDYGDNMQLVDIERCVIPRLRESRVTRITLTGGEPFAHPQLCDIVRALRGSGFSVGICTNATLVSDEQLAVLANIGGIHFNVSLDGFRAESHGRFRGDRKSFAVTVETVQRIAAAGMLQGLLCTPNNLGENAEYRELCDFAVEQGAEYVLMNPLSSMGRGVRSKDRLEAVAEQMTQIEALTSAERYPEIDIVHIRFPNTSKPLAPCDAGTIVYVFTPGEVAVCPYLVFAARTPQSKHKAEEFIVGNIFRDADLAERLDKYRFHERYQVAANPTCGACGLKQGCGKGCPAAVIANGGRIGDLDSEVCPVVAVPAPGQR